MHTTPAPYGQNGLSKKEFWIAAYLAALHRAGPDDALAEADKALSLCDARWQKPEYIAHWQYRHDFPIGHAFETPNGD